MVTRTLVAVWLLVMATLVLAGCVGPTLHGSDQAISDRYPEAEVFYLAANRIALDESRGYLPLLPVSQGLTQATPIEEGAAVTVLAQGVRLPLDAPRKMDAVVVVDVRVAGSANATEPVVVGYFPDAQPGQRLPFQSLRVFSEDTWDPKFAFEFRVRVFDWRERSNERIVAAIRQAEEIGKKLASGALVLPDPVVRNAIDAASDLIRRRPNVAIIDFRVGMYSEKQVQAAAGRIPLLRQGSWIVAAKPKNSTPEYWMRSFVFADPGQAIFTLKEGKLSERLDLPFLEVAVGQFATQPGRARVLEEASSVLVDAGSEKWKNDPDAVARSSFSLWSVSSSIVAVRQFENARDEQTRKDRFRHLFELLSYSDRLQPADRAGLLSYVRGKVGESPIPSDPKALALWWQEYGEEGLLNEDGKWSSPFGRWVNDVRSPPRDSDYRVLTGKLIPRLVQALGSSNEIPSNPDVANPRQSLIPKVGPQDRELIINLFEDIRKNSSRIVPLDSADQIIAWWGKHGRFGEVRSGLQGPYWCSFAVLVAERIETNRASQIDFCYAVSAVCRKIMPISGQAKSDLDMTTFIELTAGSESDQSRLLLAIRQAAAGYRLESVEQLEQWWTKLGVDGSFESGGWKSPVSDTVIAYKNTQSLTDFDKLLRWTESGVLSQVDADMIPRDGLEWPTIVPHGRSERSFDSARAWLALVSRARQSFIDANVKADVEGNGIREFMPKWRTANASTLNSEQLRRLLLLRQAFVDAPQEYIGRTAGISAIDSFLSSRVKGGPAVPTPDQREAFLAGKAVGEGDKAVWEWTLPNP